MSAIYYCDVCKKEMPDSNHSRIKRKLGRLEIEVMHCIDGAWNRGNVCHKCITKVVLQGKAKP